MSHFGPTYAELPTGPPGPPVSVTANNANPVRLDYGATRHGFADGRRIIVAGGTGTWIAVNGENPVLIVDPFKLTIPVDATGLGAVTGTLTAKSAPNPQFDPTAFNQFIDNWKNWKESVNGGGFTLSNVNIITGSAGVSGSSALTFAAIVDGGNAARTFTLTGALPGDQIMEGWPSTLEAGLSGMMLVIAANTVEVRIFNESGAAVTPAIQSFSATTGIGAAPFRSSLSFPTLVDGGNAALTFSATGATTVQKVMESWPPTLEAGLYGMMRVSAPNTIEVRLFNRSGGPITPAVQTFGATLV